MDITVAGLGLAVHERLELHKNRITPLPGKDGGRRISVVTGIHGDELEGQYAAWLLNRRLMEHPEYLHATVDIYPAVNPLGINTIQRSIPLFDVDLNRIFPGENGGPAAEYFANEIINDVKGSDIAVDIHASNIFLREMPQVRISEETADALVPLARLLNVDFVWIYPAATVLQSTFACSMNSIGTRCLVVEMGVGMRLTPAYGEQLTEGILNLIRSEGMWDGKTHCTHTPLISRDEVAFVNAGAAGIFMAQAQHGSSVKKGQLLGIIADPLTGNINERVIAPEDGLLFTLREYPVVYPGSLLARIVTGGSRE